MSFIEVILGALGGGAVAGLISLYNAKANNTSIHADTFKKFFDEVQEWTRAENQKHVDEIQALKTEREEWFAKFDKYKEDTNKQFSEINKLIAIKECALNSAYRCPWPADIHDCPVVVTLDELLAKEKAKESKM